MRLYHRTTAKNAASILRDGFKDATKDYGLRDKKGEAILQTGVWVSDVPLDPNDGANGDTVLEVIIDAAGTDLEEFEWIEDGRRYREWLIRAEILNHLIIDIQVKSA